MRRLVADPATLEEYAQRFAANQSVTGAGSSVRTHVPCPFCAAPDYALLPTAGLEAELAKTRTCATCGRQGKGIVSNADGLWVAFVLVSGAPLPSWLLLLPRKVEGGFHPGRVHLMDAPAMPASLAHAVERHGASGA